jgi:hypothetical protein
MRGFTGAVEGLGGRSCERAWEGVEEVRAALAGCGPLGADFWSPARVGIERPERVLLAPGTSSAPSGRFLPGAGGTCAGLPPNPRHQLECDHVCRSAKPIAGCGVAHRPAAGCARAPVAVR